MWPIAYAFVGFCDKLNNLVIDHFRTKPIGVMNPSESLRMMWMSQYNPDRITLDDAATNFFNPSAMGLTLVDDLNNTQQPAQMVSCPSTLFLCPQIAV